MRTPTLSPVALAALACALCPPSPILAQTGAARGGRPNLVVQVGHSALSPGIKAVWTPDGRFLLSAADTAAVLWEAATGKEIRRFEVDSLDIRSIAYSPDGRTLATGGLSGAIHLWDVETGVEVRRLAFPQGAQGAVAIAYSPDGRLVLAADRGGGVRSWDARTGAEVRRIEGDRPFVGYAAFSLDGRLLLTARHEGAEPESERVSIRLREVETGRELRRLEWDGRMLRSVALSPDGRLALAVGDGEWRLWQTGTGALVRSGTGQNLVAGAFSPDGRLLAVGGPQVRVLDCASFDETWTAMSGFGSAESVAFSPDERFLVVGSAILQTLDVASGRSVRRFLGKSFSVSAIAASPDGRLLLTASLPMFRPRLWDLDAGGEGRGRFELGLGLPVSIAFSPDGRYVLTGFIHNVPAGGAPIACLWDAATGSVLRRFEASDWARTRPSQSTVWFSPDGRMAVIATSGWRQPRLDCRGEVGMWDLETGAEARRVEVRDDTVDSAAMSADGRFLLTVGSQSARVWDAKTGVLVRRLGGKLAVNGGVLAADGCSAVLGSVSGALESYDVATGSLLWERKGTYWGSPLAASPDGKLVAVRLGGDVAVLLDVATGAEVRRFERHGGLIGVAFLPGNKRLATCGMDGTVRLWDVGTGRELCRLVSFLDGRWVVVDSEGRFDTNTLDEVDGLHWVAPDDPLRPLPLEIFMRDYYEPRLLARILAREPLRPVPDLSPLNRAQPEVAIASIDRKTETADEVSVSVEVSRGKREVVRDDRARVQETDAYDLHLFRDGQLVASAPGHLATDPKTGRATLTFPGLRLPQRREPAEVEFSAYAFNVDRVKSATARKRFPVPAGAADALRRAYVIAVGANTSEDPRLSLRFAANDASRVLELATGRLRTTGQFEDVVAVRLVSDGVERGATKANLKAAIDLLAGRQVEPERVRAIPNGEALRRARPEDLVLISFSGHGYTGDRGEFFLVPSDIGAGAAPALVEEGARKIGLSGSAVTDRQSVLRRCVSSEELAVWLRDVDAGEMAVIVDACYAAASVEGEGFKPGPMGSRGLGQLAYDKGMRVLAATQSDDVALERKALEQGLLSYALTTEGLGEGRADHKPKDGEILLGEWLTYAAERVPSLAREAAEAAGAAVSEERPRLVVTGQQRGGPLRRFQQPALFDFSRLRRDPLIAR